MEQTKKKEDKTRKWRGCPRKIKEQHEKQQKEDDEKHGDKVDDSKPRRTLELNGATTRGSKGIVYAADEAKVTEVSNDNSLT